MTNFSYSTRTLIDRQTFGVALSRTSNDGIVPTRRGLAERLYGSSFFPNSFTVPAGSTVDEVERFGQAFDNLAILQPILNPNRIWIPNINLDNYSASNSGGFSTVLPKGKDYYYIIVYWTLDRYLVTNVSVFQPPKPNYLALLHGYPLDTRTVPSKPKIIPSITEDITIGYYRQNPYENIGFASIDWMTYNVELTKNKPIYLPIIDCVLGTFYCSSQAVLSKISNLPTLSNRYAYSDYLPTAISGYSHNGCSYGKALASRRIGRYHRS